MKIRSLFALLSALALMLGLCATSAGAANFEPGGNPGGGSVTNLPVIHDTSGKQAYIGGCNGVARTTKTFADGVRMVRCMFIGYTNSYHDYFDHAESYTDWYLRVDFACYNSAGTSRPCTNIFFDAHHYDHKYYEIGDQGCDFGGKNSGCGTQWDGHNHYFQFDTGHEWELVSYTGTAEDTICSGTPMYNTAYNVHVQYGSDYWDPSYGSTANYRFCDTTESN